MFCLIFVKIIGILVRFEISHLTQLLSIVLVGKILPISSFKIFKYITFIFV